MNHHSDMEMSAEQQIAHVRLIRTSNIGPRTFTLLMRRYGNAIEALRAVPGPPADSLSRGCNRLIRDGATLIQNKDDLLECITPTS